MKELFWKRFRAGGVGGHEWPHPHSLEAVNPAVNCLHPAIR